MSANIPHFVAKLRRDYSKPILFIITFFVLSLNSPFSLALNDEVPMAKDALDVELSSPLIHLNEASLIDLVSLNGVGEKKALAIIEYRDSKGGFKSIEELLEVKGIGRATLERNREILAL